MRDGKLHAKLSVWAGGLSIRSCLISLGAIVALALGFAPGLRAGHTAVSISGMYDLRVATSSIERVSSISETDYAAASFDERFTGAVDSRDQGSVALPILPPAATRKPLRVANASAQVDSSLLSDAAAHVAIYDIAAHQVYLPNGRRLEAHSGLGKYRDDPRRVGEKDRGPTPPNVYDLSFRDHLFHGVRAIRLIPAGIGNMFGRDGILAHTYMRGPSGQSNGCVSFSDYHAFLDAVRSGEINRLVVVERLAAAPTPLSTEWPPEGVKALLGSIQSASSGTDVVMNPRLEVTDDPAPVEVSPVRLEERSED